MSLTVRGADLLAQSLHIAGIKRIFTLSGNQIMSVFDAALDAGLELLHVRHEAAAVHMADAWGRLTGEPGIALVTAGPGFANCLSALYVAQMAESPMILLSGRAPDDRTAFQDMPQSEMASYVCKTSWTVADAARIGRDVARAFVVAQSGRPGPVHLCLPVDRLEKDLVKQDDLLPAAENFFPERPPFEEHAARQILDELRTARRPLILCGPAMIRDGSLNKLEAAAGVPVVGMESPRGVNDPSLGAFAEVLAEADTILLLGKKLDFMLRLRGKPAYAPECHLLPVIDDLAKQAASALIDLATNSRNKHSLWLQEVRAAIEFRPEDWRELSSRSSSGLHPAEVCRVVDQFLADGLDSVFVCDGGEFGQWAQACISAPHRIINGLSGSIGSVIPFVLTARLAFPDSRIVAT